MKVIGWRKNQVVLWSGLDDYFTLNYVWGDYIASLHELPLLIRDVIRVVQNLVDLYLWVDRYCIDQSSHSDQEHQIL